MVPRWDPDGLNDRGIRFKPRTPSWRRTDGRRHLEIHAAQLPHLFPAADCGVVCGPRAEITDYGVLGDVQLVGNGKLKKIVFPAPTRRRWTES
ncbi:HIT family hydrolase [Anopheles sinensis]|uniref:HIT family hydrolase n=1 Tax=Anopheles sinensis TaxID=74873 RepID=A0A084W888_ANOSI|nr:HIT family hydrolase [Anopheles sinensis]